MKFCGLIEYNMGNFFLKKSYTTYYGETSPRPFLKHQNLACLWINSMKFYTESFYCKSKLRTTKTKVLNACFYFL